MAYRDFTKKHPTLGEIIIPIGAGVVVGAVLAPVISWYAGIAGLVTAAVLSNRAL
jgi:hypothetical protein